MTYHQALRHAHESGADFDKPVDDLPELVQKSESLQKGSLQRRMPFNPLKDQPQGQQLENIHTWQGYGEGARKARDSLKMDTGAVRDRFLHKLSAKTQTRQAKNGGREFLLHRGAKGAKLLPDMPKGTNHDTHILQDRNSSWTPKYDQAWHFAYNTETQRPDRLDSAWIHENNILTIPNQYGNVPSGSATRGSNGFSNEHEVIVKPHLSERANYKHEWTDEPKQDLNTRITNRGKQGYGHFDNPKAVLRAKRIARLESSEKSLIKSEAGLSSLAKSLGEAIVDLQKTEKKPSMCLMYPVELGYLKTDGEKRLHITVSYLPNRKTPPFRAGI
jgi:hypothetical protein